MKWRIVSYLIITALACLAYLPTFTGDFILDDQALVKNNLYIRELHSLTSYLSQEDGIVDPGDKGLFHTGYYRPLINVTYWIDYKIWGMNPVGFRTTNLILHLLACLLLYELIMLLGGNREGAFWGALFFALHPVQTETVAMIVSRNNILVTLFLLTALYSYLLWWKKRSAPALGISLLAFIGALFSKEFGFSALPVFFLYHRLLAEEKDSYREIVSYIPYMAITACYLLLRESVVDSSLALPGDIWRRVGFIPYLVVYNLKLLFLPYNLHSFRVLYPSSLLAPLSLLAMFITAVLAGAVYFIRAKRLLLFCFFSALVTLLPVLNVIAKASVSLIAMRWLYLPSAFLAIGLAWGFNHRASKEKRLSVLICTAIAIYFSGFTYVLNLNLWHDNQTFLRQEVLHFNNQMYSGDYAQVLLEQKQYPAAERLFLLSLDNYPLQSFTYINYAALLIETGRPSIALQILDRAKSLIKASKETTLWHINMGSALTMEGQLNEALTFFNLALAREPDNPIIHNNLVVLILKIKRPAEAAAHFRILEALKKQMTSQPEGRMLTERV
jgi:tetratricopeptide (TPR) repeat protein